MPRSAEGILQPGGRLLVNALLREGIDRIFSLPGESFLPVLDALHDEPRIELVGCRHEGAAAFMAEADGKLTGRPGVCLVTRAPGAAHASIGLHTALQDSTPFLLLIGQVPRDFEGREAFQEVDFRRVFGPLAKAVVRIADPGRIPAAVARACQLAVSGRPGPVVLELPEDVLRAEAAERPVRLRPRAAPAPRPADLARLRRRLLQASRPLLILGGGGWTEQAVADIAAFAGENRLPVAVSFRRQQLFDHALPNFVGHLGVGPSPDLARRLREADLLIALGTRLGEIATSGYTLISPPRPSAGLIHVHADPSELGRVYRPDLGLAAAPPQIAAALRQLPPVKRPRWSRLLPRLRAEYEAYSRLPDPSPGRPFTLTDVMAAVEPRLPADAIVTNGAGNFTGWVHRYHRYRCFGSQLAPTSGAMGYGVPAAIAAKLRHPQRTVLCFAGDGDFMIYPQELATAASLRLSVIFIVANNGMYGTIRMHQERRYPGRVIGTDLANPDFAHLARALGCHGETAASADAVGPAFERALGRTGPSLIDCRVDRSQLTPEKRLGPA